MSRSGQCFLWSFHARVRVRRGSEGPGLPSRCALRAGGGERSGVDDSCRCLSVVDPLRLAVRRWLRPLSVGQRGRPSPGSLFAVSCVSYRHTSHLRKLMSVVDRIRWPRSAQFLMAGPLAATPAKAPACGSSHRLNPPSRSGTLDTMASSDQTVPHRRHYGDHRPYPAPGAVGRPHGTNSGHDRAPSHDRLGSQGCLTTLAVTPIASSSTNGHY
jgi:hypothetical protein